MIAGDGFEVHARGPKCLFWVRIETGDEKFDTAGTNRHNHLSLPLALNFWPVRCFSFTKGMAEAKTGNCDLTQSPFSPLALQIMVPEWVFL